MTAKEELERYMKEHPRDGSGAFMKRLLEAIRRREITTINVNGTTYEVYADVLESA